MLLFRGKVTLRCYSDDELKHCNFVLVIKINKEKNGKVAQRRMKLNVMWWSRRGVFAKIARQVLAALSNRRVTNCRGALWVAVYRTEEAATKTW